MKKQKQKGAPLTKAQVRLLFDPATRWDLYKPAKRVYVIDANRK